MRVKIVLIATFAAVLFAATVHAETWYLMAADEKVMSEPQTANVMSKGSMVGPVHFISQGEFNSRHECETDRHKLIHDWRKHSIIANGGWAKHGITTPNAFAQCISDADRAWRNRRPPPAPRPGPRWISCFTPGAACRSRLRNKGFPPPARTGYSLSGSG